MKKLLTGLIFSLIFTISNGQKIDSTQIKLFFEYINSSENNSNLYIKYCKSDQLDAADSILKKWQDKCGLTEPIFRATVLLLIKEHKFSEDLFDSIAINYSFVYSIRMRQNNPSDIYFKNPAQYGFIPIGSGFDIYTSQLANELINEYLIGSIERLYCLLYLNDINSFFSQLKSNRYSTSKIKKVYNQVCKEVYDYPALHSSVSLGTWIPTSNATLFGIHPVIGFQLGIKKGKTDYNFTVDVKPNKSKSSYSVLSQGRTFETNYFLGGYIGFNMTREIYNFSKFSMCLLGGIGLDEIDVLEENQDDAFTENDNGLTLSTVNYNFGLRYQYRLKTGAYIGLETKYNILNFDNKGGTNISGDAFTIHFIYGNFINSRRKNLLKGLYYY